MAMHTTENSDLNWLAFRYVAGEMSEAECDTFERRLADDQNAREAVLREVRLLETLAAGDVPPSQEPATIEFVRESVVAGRRESHGGRNPSRAVLTLAALSAAASVGFAVWSWSQPVVRDFHRLSTGQLAADQSREPWSEVMTLWTAWTQAGAPDDGSPGSSIAAFMKAETDMSADAVDTIEGAGESAEQEFEVPGWMIAALTPERPSGPENSGDVPLEN